ncbi:MAG: Gluconate 2-dehydrogenase subunit 3 [Verrucomicrobia bacterium]|nr:MAG: Gluconate 2-dehydrogenase subunit 3 [Verrucomicrobiota bacterium]
MKRREIIKLAALSAGALLAPGSVTSLAASSNAHPGPGATPAQETLLAELVEVIIPTTDTPGAKAAGVEKFIVRLLRDCHQPEEQARFYKGLADLEADALKTFALPFLQLSTAQRTELLKLCSVRDKAFFLKLKQLTVTGYFTSEIGATQALVYLPIPGRFEGSTPMAPGQRAWAL